MHSFTDRDAGKGSDYYLLLLLPASFVYFPLGFASESNFKHVVLIRNHVSLV
uniref:Uncharacterized protein n=1 Tax=Candidatus Kentrum sp. TUN TaxID=2126343 RepID=A0A450ZDS8_9GAMM|nr:MAG: hypothetical protein BECKTUN1418E_GA0071001_100413 [Candidatus Kentron sp. TUN]VFK50968.1 MAG: hypothetical protein BECKTUN1418D_GA0071000_10044 [Candidatus Kentron sp. TUN]VFK51934.1 MAG: hypothetical protein BECKTUN1418F_GA0071002_100413 [Candidatus Kentron sp. TUN]